MALNCKIYLSIALAVAVFIINARAESKQESKSGESDPRCPGRIYIADMKKERFDPKACWEEAACGIGATVNCTCFRGYRPHDGGCWATCGADRKWTLNSGCDVITCGTPPEVEHASAYDAENKRSDEGQHLYGSMIGYRCKNGYQLANRRSSMYACREEGWVVTGKGEVACVVGDCGEPPRLRYAGDPLYENTTHGSRAYYQCLTPGFAIQGGEGLQCDGSIKKWIPFPVMKNKYSWFHLRCKQIPTCHQVEAPVNGRVVNVSSHYQNGTATFSCDPGYQLTHNETSVCMAEHGYVTSRGAMVKGWYPPLAKCVYSCKPTRGDGEGDLEKTRVRIKHCTTKTSDSSFSRYDPLRTCSEPQVFELIKNDDRPGDYITFNGQQVCVGLNRKHVTENFHQYSYECLQFCMDADGDFRHVAVETQDVMGKVIQTPYIYEKVTLDFETGTGLQIHL